MLSIGQLDSPRTPWQARPKGGRRGGLFEHRSPGGSLPCPGLTLLCPGRVRGRLKPTQRSSCAPNLLPILLLRNHCEGQMRCFGHRQSVASSLLKAVLLVRCGRGRER